MSNGLNYLYINFTHTQKLPYKSGHYTVMGGFQGQFKQESIIELIYRGVTGRHEAKIRKLGRQTCSGIKHETVQAK